jgi:hypothetical protein
LNAVQVAVAHNPFGRAVVSFGIQPVSFTWSLFLGLPKS